MRRLLTLLWKPLFVEIATVLVHFTIRREAEDINWLDIVNASITAAVLLFAGWTVYRNLNRLSLSVLGAVVIWFSSGILFVLLAGLDSLLQVSPPDPPQKMVIIGFVTATVLSAPFAILLSVAGAMTAKWMLRLQK